MYKIYEDNPDYKYGCKESVYINKDESYDKFSEQRLSIMKGMHSFVKQMNDERAYESWCYVVPDQASDEDLRYCANDAEIFDGAIELFMMLVQSYGKSGLYFSDMPSIIRVGDNCVSHHEIYSYSEGE